MPTSTPDITLLCPHCAQPLECPEEAIGVTVNCPVCNGPFTVESPASAAPALAEQRPVDQVRHWIVEVRVLVLRAPPAYIRVLIEAPKSWVLPKQGALPEPAFETVANAVRTKFPQGPITPVTACAAGEDALKRCADRTDYSNAFCRVWLLGRSTSTL